MSSQSPIKDRARCLNLTNQGQSRTAWFAQVNRSDLEKSATHVDEQGGFAPEAFLNEDELRQVQSFRFAPPRENFLLGRLAAKLALGALLKEPDWRQIQITKGVLGQPLVAYARPHGAEVSLSHSEGVAIAVAFPREHPLAVDLETVDVGRADTIKKVMPFSAAETHWLQSRAANEPTALVLLWTIKEALGKVLKCGITCPLELLAADQIKPIGDALWESHYRNFQQYKCLSWQQNNQVISLVLPTATEVTLPPW
ncbi:MAG: 4'-phosphopantetheinyl transferase superfamily protein [Verrucomicrobiota bacterium]